MRVLYCLEPTIQAGDGFDNGIRKASKPGRLTSDFTKEDGSNPT